MPDYGPYVYYVRCADSEGNSNGNSEVINFDYQNPNPEPDPGLEPGATATTSGMIVCTELQIGLEDGVCDRTEDCICDPDCPESGGDVDIDCANVVRASDGNGWVAVVFIGLILLIIVIIIIIIIRRRGSEEEDVELP